MFNVEVRNDIPTNDNELCSPFILDNLLEFSQGKRIDGCYISVNNNYLLFEKEWTRELILAIENSLKEIIVWFKIVYSLLLIK